MSRDIKVLIVEDSSAIRFEVKLILKQHKIILLEAGHEKGMFENIEENNIPVDLIIMDITLKFENGFDLIKKVKSIGKYKDIPILVLSEHADISYVIEAKKLNVEGYIKKPINPTDFINKIKSILAKRSKIID